MKQDATARQAAKPRKWTFLAHPFHIACLQPGTGEGGGFGAGAAGAGRKVRSGSTSCRSMSGIWSVESAICKGRCAHKAGVWGGVGCGDPTTPHHQHGGICRGLLLPQRPEEVRPQLFVSLLCSRCCLQYGSTGWRSSTTAPPPPPPVGALPLAPFTVVVCQHCIAGDMGVQCPPEQPKGRRGRGGGLCLVAG